MEWDWGREKTVPRLALPSTELNRVSPVHFWPGSCLDKCQWKQCSSGGCWGLKPVCWLEGFLCSQMVYQNHVDLSLD